MKVFPASAAGRKARCARLPTASSAPEAWKGRDSLESSQGHAIDHIGFSVENLDQTLERLKKDGVKVTEEPRSLFNGQLKYAFIQGPDHLRIEVLEDHSANR